MKKIINLILASSTMIFSLTAFPCSYFINEVAAQNDLIASASTELQAGLQDWKSISLKSFRWYESISTPMCPEEMTFEATVMFEYKTSGVADCYQTISVKRVDNWTNQDQTYTFGNRVLSGACVTTIDIAKP
jgi:hypothetical protein